jgi:hypothetical protein
MLASFVSFLAYYPPSIGIFTAKGAKEQKNREEPGSRKAAKNAKPFGGCGKPPYMTLQVAHVNASVPGNLWAILRDRP